MTTEPIEKHLTLSSDCDSVSDLLAAETGLSKQKLKQAMQKGCVWWGVASKCNVCAVPLNL
jgi:hypothetical protein